MNSNHVAGMGDRRSVGVQDFCGETLGKGATWKT